MNFRSEPYVIVFLPHQQGSTISDYYGEPGFGFVPKNGFEIIPENLPYAVTFIHQDEFNEPEAANLLGLNRNPRFGTIEIYTRAAHPIDNRKRNSVVYTTFIRASSPIDALSTIVQNPRQSNIGPAKLSSLNAIFYLDALGALLNQQTYENAQEVLYYAKNP